MKKRKGSYLLTVLLIWWSLPAFSIDLETLRAKVNHINSQSDFLETERLVTQNLSLAEQILFLRDSSSQNNSGARSNTIEILKNCAETGKISSIHYFEVILRLYNQITSIAHSEFVKQDIYLNLA